jgi:hypothetical protein
MSFVRPNTKLAARDIKTLNHSGQIVELNARLRRLENISADGRYTLLRLTTSSREQHEKDLTALPVFALLTWAAV